MPHIHQRTRTRLTRRLIKGFSASDQLADYGLTGFTFRGLFRCQCRGRRYRSRMHLGCSEDVLELNRKTMRDKAVLRFIDDEVRMKVEEMASFYDVISIV